MNAFGHIEYSLSELDIRMVKAIQPGGNWKDIPLDVPSKRLEQIRLSGGRTTLYGRLRWDKPSYTITTYFNRPGNGCYIHPALDRVLTPLEAARLQSFPDSFQFLGSKTSLTKQIGNAVPPLLAFAVASQIKRNYPKLVKTVDLFSGSGGMSQGFKWAGFDTVVANDFYKEAALTYRHNFPETSFFFGDIKEPATTQAILFKIREKGGVDVVIGGPPCQGFSNAGKRLIDDPRNSLYKEFVSIVEKTNPKIFVMENVEGILSLDKGRIYKSIKEDFEALGYSVAGRKLLATHYGVPQRRKRVIIIGSRIGDPEKLFPEQIVEEHNFVTVKEAIGDIPKKTITNIHESVEILTPKTNYQCLMQNKITPQQFLNYL